MTQPQTLEDWLSLIQTIHPREMDLGLARISQVANAMRLTQLNIPIITVAGTNGKGSTVALLNGFFLKAGFRVASYTSPHLVDFNERIQINGNSINDEALIAAFSEIHTTALSLKVSLTYFEYAFLAALYIFLQRDLDVIIIEVGLGGRLDATNIVSPTIAVITNVDFDHMHILGETREKIGFEKAGICRKNIPVVFGDHRPVMSITEHARSLGAPLLQCAKDFEYRRTGDTWIFENQQWHWQDLPVPAVPLVNAAISLEVLSLVSSFLPVSIDSVKSVLTELRLAGRWQLWPHPRGEIRLDVAHNPQSAAYLLQLAQDAPITGRHFAVCSILKDKDQIQMFKPLAGLFAEWWIAPLTHPRGSTVTALHQALVASGVTHIHDAPSIAIGLTEASSRLEKGDRLIVFGSFFTVSEALKALDKTRYTR